MIMLFRLDNNLNNLIRIRDDCAFFTELRNFFATVKKFFECREVSATVKS